MCKMTERLHIFSDVSVIFFFLLPFTMPFEIFTHSNKKKMRNNVQLVIKTNNKKTTGANEWNALKWARTRRNIQSNKVKMRKVCGAGGMVWQWNNIHIRWKFSLWLWQWSDKSMQRSHSSHRWHVIWSSFLCAECCKMSVHLSYKNYFFPFTAPSLCLPIMANFVEFETISDSKKRKQEKILRHGCGWHTKLRKSLHISHKINEARPKQTNKDKKNWCAFYSFKEIEGAKNRDVEPN